MARKAKILVATCNKALADAVKRALVGVPRKVDVVLGATLPKSFDPYLLLISEVGESAPKLETLLAGLRPDAQVVLVLPQPDLALMAELMRDSRVCHFVAKQALAEELPALVEKLETGAIFGLERYLAEEQELHYRRIDSYNKRSMALEELDAFARRKRLRGRQRRAISQVAEELLMNAMYQAPVDEKGERVFAGVSPRRRVRRRSPRPVSLRFGVDGKSFILSVRDRFGSFQRDDLARYLLRCTKGPVELEKKELGAGLGLYLVSSSATRLAINVLPGSVAEFIATIGPEWGKTIPIRCLSVTTQRARDRSE